MQLIRLGEVEVQEGFQQKGRVALPSNPFPATFTVDRQRQLTNSSSGCYGQKEGGLQ